MRHVRTSGGSSHVGREIAQKGSVARGGSDCCSLPQLKSPNPTLIALVAPWARKPAKGRAKKGQTHQRQSEYSHCHDRKVPPQQDIRDREPEACRFPPPPPNPAELSRSPCPRHLRAVMPRCARLSHELRPRRRGAVPASLAPTRPRTPRRRPPPPPGLPTCCSFFLADYCEYCDISLTHSSVPGRKQHHTGRKHIMNYIEYWASYQAALPTTPPPSAYRPPPRPRACPCPRTPVEAHHTSTPMPPPLT